MEIRQDYLTLYKQLQKYRKKRGGRWVYDLVRAGRELPLFRKYSLGQSSETPRNEEPCGFIYRLGKRINEKYVPVLEPKDDPLGFVEAKEVFGRTGGKRGYNALMDEIRSLIWRGEDYEKHKRRLRRTYHLKMVRDTQGGAKIRFDELRELWDYVFSDIQTQKEKMSPGEIEFCKGAIAHEGGCTSRPK